MSFPGKVRRRACGQHTSESKNVRMRGRSCPKAWVFPVPERVCPKVEANPHKSQLSRSVEEGWKRGRNARTPAHVCRGAFSRCAPRICVLLLLAHRVHPVLIDCEVLLVRPF